MATASLRCAAVRPPVSPPADAAASPCLLSQGKRSWGRDLEDLKCEEERVRGFVFRTKKANDKIVRTIPKCAPAPSWPPSSLRTGLLALAHAPPRRVEILAVQKAGVLFTTGGPGGLRALASAHSEHERAYAQEQQVRSPLLPIRPCVHPC